MGSNITSYEFIIRGTSERGVRGHITVKPSLMVISVNVAVLDVY